MFADVAGLLLAFAAAELAFGPHDVGRFSFAVELLLFLVTLPGWVLVARLYGLYERDRAFADHTTPDELAGIFHLTTVGTWLFWIISWATGFAALDFPELVALWILATVLVTGARAFVRTLLRPHIALQNAVIFGAGDAGQQVALKLLTHPEYGIRVLCLVDPEPRELRPELVDLSVLRRPGALWEVIGRHDVHRVVLAFSNTPDKEWLDLTGRLRLLGVHIDVVPRLFEVVGPGADLHAVEGFSLLHLPPLVLPQMSRLKRATDVLASSVAIVVLLPAFLLIAIAIKLDSPGPVLYRSERMGTSGRRVFLLKFRTMRDTAGADLDRLLQDEAANSEFTRIHKLRDDPRVTRVGRWLRRASLDELPQLLDVLRGELSLVGPRPITKGEFEALDTGHAGDGDWTGIQAYWELAGVRPGLTGLWQINGRSTIDYEERVRLDNLYLTNWSFRLDLLILAKTLRSVVTSTGAY